jgi:drug/metabolite transporter (DMT)-like permease
VAGAFSFRRKPVEKLRDWGILALGVLAISWGGPLVRFTSAPALTVAAWRMGIAALLLLPFGGRGWKGKEALYAGVAGIFLAAHFAFWIQSLRLTSVASSVVLVNTNPLFVGLFSWLLGERAPKAFWVGVGLALLGVGLIGLGDLRLGKEALWGDFLALLGAVAASGYLVLGRHTRERIPFIPYVSLTYFVAAFSLFPLALAFGHILPPKGDWIWLFLLGLVPQVLGHTSVNWALRRFPASAVAISILGEPIGASLWAFLLFGERIGTVQGIGIVLLLFGIFWGLRAFSR